MRLRKAVKLQRIENSIGIMIGMSLIAGWVALLK